jgi:hypothetical protein
MVELHWGWMAAWGVATVLGWLFFILTAIDCEKMAKANKHNCGLINRNNKKIKNQQTTVSDLEDREMQSVEVVSNVVGQMSDIVKQLSNRFLPDDEEDETEEEC